MTSSVSARMKTKGQQWIRAAAVALVALVACGGSGGANGPSGASDGGTDAARQGVAPDSGRPPDDGTPCTVQSTQCDPECQESCGTDPACTDACCLPVNTVGAYCKGYCVPSSVKDCDGKCTNTQYDNMNCGGCSNQCGVNQTCVGGKCMTAAVPDGG